MKITQISVFLENKKGRLYDACELLGKNGINICMLTIAESADYGILRIVVDNPEKALTVLKRHDFTANIADIVAVEVGDQPGGLAKVLKVLNEQNLNVEYMYGFEEKNGNKALLILRFDDPDQAIQSLQRNGIKVLPKNEIMK